MIVEAMAHGGAAAQKKIYWSEQVKENEIGSACENFGEE